MKERTGPLLFGAPDLAKAWPIAPRRSSPTLTGNPAARRDCMSMRGRASGCSKNCTVVGATDRGRRRRRPGPHRVSGHRGLQMAR
jgi:hypothetical protein